MVEHNKPEYIHASISYPRSSTQPSLAGLYVMSLRIIVFGRRQIYQLMVKFRNFGLSLFFLPEDLSRQVYDQPLHRSHPSLGRS
jgi:hypothetical protein